MPDWNGDGKRDWHDDFVYNEILNTKKSDGSSRGSANSKSSAGTTIIIVIVIVILWEIINAIASVLY